MPFHFYVEQIGVEKWVTIKSSPLQVQSEWLKTNIEYGYIPDAFRDATVIAVQDNLSFNPMSSECMWSLGYHLVSELLYLTKKNIRDEVFYVDEIFNTEAYTRDKLEKGLFHDYPYEYVPSPFFNRQLFNIENLRFA